MFNLRGDDGQPTGGLAVDTNLGWKGAEKYVATVPQVFDLWQDPQERYDIFMNNYTERTWTLVTINEAIEELMKTYVKYPPRKLQSEVYTGPITLIAVPALPVRPRGSSQKGGLRAFRCRPATDAYGSNREPARVRRGARLRTQSDLATDRTCGNMLVRLLSSSRRPWRHVLRTVARGR